LLLGARARYRVLRFAFGSYTAPDTAPRPRLFQVR